MLSFSPQEDRRMFSSTSAKTKLKKLRKMEKKLNNSASNPLKTLYTSENKTGPHCQGSLCATLVGCRKDRTENEDRTNCSWVDKSRKYSIYTLNHLTAFFILQQLLLLPAQILLFYKSGLRKWIQIFCPGLFSRPGVTCESSDHHFHSASHVFCCLCNLISKVCCKWLRAK